MKKLLLIPVVLLVGGSLAYLTRTSDEPHVAPAASVAVSKPVRTQVARAEDTAKPKTGMMTGSVSGFTFSDKYAERTPEQEAVIAKMRLAKPGESKKETEK